MRAGEHLGLADGQLEALAAHGLHQDGELELAAALDLPGVGALGGQHAQRHVADQLLVEAVLDLAGGEPAAVAPGERRGVDADGEREARLVHRDHRQGAGVVGVGERLADGHVGQAGDRDDLAGAGRSAGTRSRASVTYSSVTFAGTTEPSARHQATAWPATISPSCTRQMARRPT